MTKGFSKGREPLISVLPMKKSDITPYMDQHMNMQTQFTRFTGMHILHKLCNQSNPIFFTTVWHVCGTFDCGLDRSMDIHNGVNSPSNASRTQE